MNLRILFFLVSLLCSSSVLAECLVSFNTYGPIYAPKITERTQFTVNELKAQHPCEVIHLQEVWNNGQIDQLETGLKESYQVYAPNREYRVGLMVVSLKPWEAAETLSFNVNYDGSLADEARRLVDTKKAFSIVKNALPETYTINTHLHPTSVPVRIAQIMDLATWRMKNAEGALIMSGDFNFNPDTLEHLLVSKMLGVEDSVLTVHKQYPPGYCTYCDKNPLGWLDGDHVLDYVFISRRNGSTAGWKPTAAQVILTGDSFPYSDHYGVKVTFEASTEKSETPSVMSPIELLIDGLNQAETHLMGFNDVDTYIATLRQIRAELQAQSGPYWDYYSRILL